MTLPIRPELGFIGLGTMGSAMARRLIAAGHEPHLWNRSEEAFQPFRKTKARICTSAEMVIDRSDVIFLMLSDDDAVESVLNLGSAGQCPTLSDKVIVNMGTGAPSQALSHQSAVEALGGTYLEAPVSGSRQPAEEGRLVSMIAGGTVYQRSVVSRLLAPLCRATIDAGTVPQALHMKLAVNLYLVTSVAALAESFHLADRLGIDLHRFAELIAASPMASDVANGKARKIAARDFSVQAAVSDVHKNCRLVGDAASEVEAMTPLLAQARALFAAQDGEHGPRLDMAAVFDSFGPEVSNPASLIVAKQLDAYQRRDLDRFMQCWAETATIVGPDGRVVAAGASAIRERHQHRFADPSLHARLLTRTAVGNIVVDQEIVRRTSAAGAMEELSVLATYGVQDGLIAMAAFAEEPVHGQ